MILKSRVCLGSILLLISVLFVFLSAYWLFKETDADKVRLFYMEYDRLVLEDRTVLAEKLINETLSGLGEVISEEWVAVLQKQVDGYDKLFNYTHLLAGNVQREETYKEISGLLDRAPQAFKDEKLVLYMDMLQEIPDVQQDLLVKYGLVGKLDNTGK